MPIEDELQDRRNDYDVTNTVQVSSAPQVRAAVADVFAALYPSTSFDSVWLAFHDFERVFRETATRFFSVNGQRRPTITMRPGEVQRWRLLGTACSRSGGQEIPCLS